MTDNITSYDHELKQAFNSQTYFVRALQRDGALYVEVEEAKSGHKWKNQFIHSYIEEMTSKTGNFKTFDKFCKMMYSALQCNSDTSSSNTVFIDLLTYQDLEILKARKAAKAGLAPQNALNATHRTKNKRYLILTYVVQFDRVHYPLALKLDEASLDATTPSASQARKPRNACATETARRLLAHSSSACSSCDSSPESKSSLTASPHPMVVNGTKHSHSQSKPRPHFQSVPNLRHAHDGNVNAENLNPNIPRPDDDEALQLQAMAAENLKLKQRLRQLSQGTTAAVAAAGHAHEEEEEEEEDEEEREEAVYERHQTADMVEVLEDEVKVLRQALEKKNLEVRRMARTGQHYEQKQIGKRLDDMEDEIERLSTELLQEKTKYRRCCREFDAERMALQKELESAQASSAHHERKCRQLKEDLAATKQTLEHVRMKASRQRLYKAQQPHAASTLASSRDSRSRSRKNSGATAGGGNRGGRTSTRERSKYGHSQYLRNTTSTSRDRNRNRNRNRGLRDRSRNSNSKLNKSGFSNASASSVASTAASSYRNRARSTSSSNRYQRSSSAPRFMPGKSTSRNKRSTPYTSRSRSPSVRFDPTAWAKDKKQKIDHANSMRNTFGATSRSPSPCHAGSRSVSPGQRQRQRSTSSKRRRKHAHDSNNKRDRSNSRKRNSFGATVSRSPRPRQQQQQHQPQKQTKKSSIPLPHDQSLNDLSVLNTMQKRQERILSMQQKSHPRHELRNNGDETSNADENDDQEEEDLDEDNESTFNPTKEIESIDSRLNALQKFLRAAKSSQ